MPASDAGNEQTAECLQLAARDESQWFERKGGRLSARDLGDALVGFANAEGGLIALGVADDGRIEGASTDRINEWRQAAQRFTDPPVRHAFRALSCTNEAGEAVGIAVVEIEPAERPHTNAKGETFLRIGDATHRLGPAEAQELRYDKGDAAFDGRMSEAGDDALDDALTERYLAATGASSRAGALTARGLAIERDGALRATNAGLLLLGAQPQLQYPEACVRVLLHEGLGRETGARANVVEDRRFEGPIVRQIDEANAIIGEWLPRAIRLGEGGRFQPQTIIPRDAWMEALVNAVTHRSYSLGGDHVRVSLFRDCVEVESPGRLPGLVRIENIRRTRFARNPRIARALGDLGYGRELGEGVNRMFEEMQRAGLPAPFYEQGPASVRLTLRADPLSARILDHLPPDSGRFAEHLAQRKRVTTTEAVDLFGRSRPTALRYLRKLEHAGFIERVGSTHDPTAYWRLVR